MSLRTLTGLLGNSTPLTADCQWHTTRRPTRSPRFLVVSVSVEATSVGVGGPVRSTEELGGMSLEPRVVGLPTTLGCAKEHPLRGQHRFFPARRGWWLDGLDPVRVPLVRSSEPVLRRQKIVQTVDERRVGDRYSRDLRIHRRGQFVRSCRAALIRTQCPSPPKYCDDRPMPDSTLRRSSTRAPKNLRHSTFLFSWKFCRYRASVLPPSLRCMYGAASNEVILPTLNET